MEVTWSSFHRSYTEAEIKKYVPREAGIYLLWVQLQSEKWRCFYTGQANNLEARLLAHLSNDEENICLRDKVSKYICGFEYTEIPNQDDRDGIEKFLHDHYLPECNQKDPGGKPIKVNLP